jgi:ribosomal protein S18 acetylase RimI-like enzyme
MVTIEKGGADWTTHRFRRARREDLPALVALLADDMLGAARERLEEPLPDCYAAAFAAIDGDASERLIVAEAGGAIVGCLQVSFIPGLSRQGAWRAQIESVRVAATVRGRGLGAKMIAHAIALAHERACRLVQLTTDKDRGDALRFYQRLGFVASHEGMKLALR